MCKYGCDTLLTWSESHKFWADAHSGELHDYKRCAEIQKEQGKAKPYFFDQPSAKWSGGGGSRQ